MTQKREEHLKALSDALQSGIFFATKDALKAYIADEDDPEILEQVLGNVLDNAASPSATLPLINAMYGSSESKIDAKKNEFVTGRLFALLPKLPPSTLERGWTSDLTHCFESLNRKMTQEASLQKFVKKEWMALIEQFSPEIQASLSSLIQSNVQTDKPLPLNKFATDCILAAAAKMTDQQDQLTYMGYHVLNRAENPAQKEKAREFLLSTIKKAANPNDIAVIVHASSNITMNGTYVDKTVDSAGAERWTKLVSGLDIAKQWEAATSITDERDMCSSLESGETLTAASKLTLKLAEHFITSGEPEKATPVLNNIIRTQMPAWLQAKELLKTIPPASEEKKPQTMGLDAFLAPHKPN